MDHDTADKADSHAALGILALISAELNAQMTLEDVTAAVLHASLELNDASVAVVANLDGAGSTTIASLERNQIPGRSGIDIRTGVSSAGGRITEEMRAAVRHSDPVAIDELPGGVVSSCIGSGMTSWRRGQVQESLLGVVDQAFGHPVRDETGALVAVLAVGWATNSDFDTDILDSGSETDQDTDIREVTELFCGLASGGLVRARHSEELSDLANQMRAELIPATISSEQLDVAFDYVPALNTIGFGGDWFDIVEPSPDRVVLVVGDIAGHGVPAAAQMALAQGAVRGLCQGSPIRDIPLLATRCLTGGPKEMLATLGLIDVDLRKLTIACQLAGHPPPMLRQPDGTVQRLGGTPLPPIGMVDAVDEPGYRIPLTPGSIVVLYSDGLIERRRADLSERLDELEALIARIDVDVPAADALKTICTGMLTDESEDDVAILVVKLRDGGIGSTESRDHTL